MFQSFLLQSNNINIFLQSVKTPVRLIMNKSARKRWDVNVEEKRSAERRNLWSRLPLARVAVAQSSSLSLFTNRDAELEQRAMLLKRLAFTIYSSEVDQYQKYLPDIQGKHSHLSQVNIDCSLEAALLD